VRIVDTGGDDIVPLFTSPLTIITPHVPSIASHSVPISRPLMRKKEYIYTHALLAEVTRYLIEDETMAVETLSEYDALGTRPSGIHESKQDHHEAIAALSSAIEPCLEDTPTESHERTVNQ